MSRFTPKSLAFLERAHKQKNPEWLDRNREEYLEVLVEPTRHLVAQVKRELGDAARHYRFPSRGFARLRRSGDRARKYGALFRDYVGVQGSRDSGSRFEDLPGLYFHLSPKDIFSAGGLYTPSARQVKRMRLWIDQDPGALEEVLSSRAFKKVYALGLGDERKLKTKPRDYPIDHPRIEWLKLTGYYVWRPLPKKVFYSSELPSVLSRDWAQVLRLNSVLDRYLARAPRMSVPERFADITAPQADWDDFDDHPRVSRAN